MSTRGRSTPLHSVSVGGAVYDEISDSFLVIQRHDNGHWQLPGGVLELNENIEDGVVREVLEETGVNVRPIKLTGVYKNVIQHVVSLVFLCEVISGKPHSTEEADEVKWMSREMLSKYMCEAFEARLLDALQSGPVAIRTHDGIHLLKPIQA